MSEPLPASLSVLVVDDEEGIRTLVQHWLQREGHDVAIAACAHEATRLLRSRRFDLVVTDVVMPDGDGFELIPEVRKVQPHARIVAMSGGGQYLQSDACLHIARGLGAHAVVMKPFNWTQLRAGLEIGPAAAVSG
jgi:DNA-binding NtrC family response regulator